MGKKTVAVFFGGPSVEHEISLISSNSIIKNLDHEKFNIFPVFITKGGRWHIAELKQVIENDKIVINDETYLVPSPGIDPMGVFLEIAGGEVVNIHRADVVFPVLHGTYGEDGSVQGCLDLMNIPYVGANVLGSSIGMDKIMMKSLLKDNGLPIVNFLGFNKFDWESDNKEIKKKITELISFPCFVKSANLGSSVGISKIDDIEKLNDAVQSSLKFSDRVLIEKAVPNPREIEVSVLGNENPFASVPGEVIPKKDFYDYDAKYHDDSTELEIPAKLDEKTVLKLKELAIKTFKILCCSGMGRIDFLVDSENGEIFISEINTIPGFTSVSMYPKLWEISGISYKELLTRLIELAEEKFENRKSIQTDL